MGSDPLFDEDDNRQANAPQELQGPWRPRFGIGFIMLAMFILSVMFGMGHYMLNESKEGGILGNRFSFLFVTLAAPMLLLTLLSIGKEVMRYWDKEARKKKRREKTEP